MLVVFLGGVCNMINAGLQVLGFCFVEGKSKVYHKVHDLTVLIGFLIDS